MDCFYLQAVQGWLEDDYRERHVSKGLGRGRGAGYLGQEEGAGVDAGVSAEGISEMAHDGRARVV